VLTVDDRPVSQWAGPRWRFIAVGSNDSARVHIGSTTRVVDGRGRTVIPGLIDTHVHALDVAAAEAVQPFRNLRSVGELQDWIRGETQRRPHETWIWTPRVFPTRLREQRFPTRHELDLAAPHHPVAVDSAYAFSLNSAALRAAGITRDTADPPGGAIVKDAAGEPTACWERRGRWLARLAGLRPPTRSSRYPALPCRHHGVIERGASLEGYHTYGELKSEPVDLRSTVTIRIPRADDSADVERFVRSLPFRFGDGDDWLKVGPLKIVADGGILIGTSFMREPYGLGARQLYAVDDPRYRGFLTPSSRSSRPSRSAIGSGGRWLRT
jgi:predicted amidohydrolase YtcJ